MQCITCKGTGGVEVVNNNGEPVIDICPDCNGAGTDPDSDLLYDRFRVDPHNER